MASKKLRSSGTWEYRYVRKDLLPKPVYRSYDTEAEGDKIAARLEAILDRGVVPSELLDYHIKTVAQLLDTYSVSQTLAPSAQTTIPTIVKAIGTTPIASITNTWLDNWITTMQATLAPNTLSKRVGILKLAVSWAMRKDLVPLTVNPMTLLPKGYAGKADRYADWTGQRDRRLSEDGAEERAIRKVLVKKEERLLFDMALESAMRMREMYTLTVDQVALDKDTIFLEKTKNGDKRQVPLSSVLKRLLVEHLPTLTSDRVFPWWDGSRFDDAYLRNLTSMLSNRFGRAFDKAGCPDLHFHDIRHEATARIFERTTLSDTEVSSITGHHDPRMLKRYANMRGSTLAKKLW